MDSSDSSVESESGSRRNGVKMDWENRANSDVSDDENFSKGAKSIDSPPESPPRGGGNLDSPPASPPSYAVGSERYEAYWPDVSNYGHRSPSFNPGSCGSSRSSSRTVDTPSSQDRSPLQQRQPNSPPPAPSSSAIPRTPPDSPKSEQSDDEEDHRRGRRDSIQSQSDDGRSNISSNSSIGSGPSSPAPPPPNAKIEIKSHGEDLSDVSDVESLGTVSDSETEPEKKIRKDDEEDRKDKSSVSGLNTLDEAEQLDFEAEEDKDDDKERDNAVASEMAVSPSSNDKKKSEAGDEGNCGEGAKKSCDGDEEGEVKELEDGEISDEGENRPEETEPRPVCRFFSRGQCTWGSSCSFRHVLEETSPDPLPSQEPSCSNSGLDENENSGGGGMTIPPATTKSGLLPHPGTSIPILLSTAAAAQSNVSVGLGFPLLRPPGLPPYPRFFRPWIRRGMIGLRFFGPRFVHPGVTDKGNYTMFDMVRPLVPMNSGPPPPPHMFGGPIDSYGPRPIDRPMIGPTYQQPAMRRDDAPGESAWERGLRQAKEMLRRSSKRKETDVDFEEKKMNLTLSGPDEYDKENDYYTRPSSPIFADDIYHDRYPVKESSDKRYRSVSDRFGDYPPPTSYYPSGGGSGGAPERGSIDGRRSDQWYEERSSRYHHSSSRHHSGGYPSSRSGNNDRAPSDDYFDNRTRKKYSSREVVVQRSDKSSWKDGSIGYDSPSPRGGGRASERTGGGRGDEWADPWMRSKSPSRKSGGATASRASRKKSYSSRSSYSSSSSSRSSSYSSYSRSRSRTRSSGSRSITRTRSRSRSAYSRKKAAPSPPPKRSVKSPFSRAERRGVDTERSLHMNPPPPSPRAVPSPPSKRNPTPPSDRSNSRNISARLIAAAMREKSYSSRSSSGSESSGSSSDSSSDTGSSSSSGSLSPQQSARTSNSSSKMDKASNRVNSSSTSKKIGDVDDKFQTTKVKAMDAMKISGQKQQIKLTLKGNTGSSDRLQPTVPISRKRLADSPIDDDDDAPGGKKKQPPPSRREELLKQLKAVEDAIARKRSKI